jgi:hypothetical protein
MRNDGDLTEVMLGAIAARHDMAKGRTHEIRSPLPQAVHLLIEKDVPWLLAMVRHLQGRVAELEPNARLGRAVREMPSKSRLRHTDGSVPSMAWVYDGIDARGIGLVRAYDTPDKALGLGGEASDE